jgi:hypothetical protein
LILYLAYCNLYQSQEPRFSRFYTS